MLAGAGYAALLYFRERKNEFGTTLRTVLAVLRAITITGIALLLLNPLIRSVRKNAEKPVVLILQDNSESVLTGKDSTFYRASYPGLVRTFTESLGKDFNVQSFTFGGAIKDGLTIDFTEVQTNTGEAFEGIYNRFSHKNVGALVLLSDGINNRGSNPLYTDYNFNFPVYCVALGDTSLQRDLIVSHVNYNRLAYLDSQFPLEINVTGKKCKGLGSVMTIERNGEILYQTRLSFDADFGFRTIQTSLLAKSTGMQRYTVKLAPIEGEVSYANNIFDIYIDVLEDKQKILLLADAPHPDVSAIKQAVSENINYQLDEFLITDFKGSVKEYNLVILHGLPSVRNNSTAILRTLDEDGIPTLFILSKNTFLPLFNEQKTGLVIETRNILYNEALPYLNGDFNLFGISDRIKETVPRFPPLVSPYGSLQLNPSAVPFLYQQIGSLTTGQPQWIFNQAYDRKTAVILGTGIWKWRIKEYGFSATHEAFDDIINRTIQFLALKIDKSLFRVYAKNNYGERDDIELEAELYNDVYELINDPDIPITVTGSDGTNYPYEFSRTTNAYYLNAGNLPPDTYTYSSQVDAGGSTLTESGEFTVRASRLEQLNTEADHDFLFNLARKYGGEMVYPAQFELLENKIRQRDDIKTVVYYQKRFSEVLNIPYLMILILLLLSIEWFVRKRAGGY